MFYTHITSFARNLTVKGTKFSTISDCIKVAIETMCLIKPLNLAGVLFMPFVSAGLNNHVNHLLTKETDNIIMCMIFKGVMDYLSYIIQSNISYGQIRILCDSLMLRLHMAKIKCGASLPGINQKHHKDLVDDSSKLRDFTFLLPMLWSSLVNFSITIYMMETQSEYPIRILFSLFCIFMLCIITYLTDPTVYEKTKPSPTSIVKFDDANFVRMKMSLGCNMDTEFDEKKRKKIDAQQNIQKYVILMINLIITFISLSTKNIGQLHAFGNISWMIGCLADNIKSFQYYTYMREFIDYCKCLESHHLVCDENKIPVGKINEVSFVNASFGYYSDDLMKKPTKIEKITDLTYTFNKEVLYYLEAPNGFGKSTMLKMFTHNLFSGDVFFGTTNRKNLSFEDISSSVFHIVQATEYTPKFSKEEIDSCKGRDTWLERQLGLENLFGKDTVEMSGGEKKRILVYMVLTSKSPIILLDEILSELSVEETPLVPEGGGWLTRIIKTLANWKGRQNKIMILVGHGLLEIIPIKAKLPIVKLKIDNTNTKSVLYVRH
jgi:ABC-type cobalamin/Fe3+-siderophores transport system ATPase subunit